MAIKLPEDLNPFKNLDDFDFCWCGSLKIYVACHKKRGEAKSINVNQGISKLSKKFKKSIGCLHPLAPDDCSGRIVSSHSIQKSGPLKSISINGHVYSTKSSLKNIVRNNGRLVPTKSGISDVSVFPGFCSKHDNEYFLPVESGVFEITSENCFLFYYRNVCNELHAKHRMIFDEELLEGMDAGLDLMGQLFVQEFSRSMNAGAELAKDALELKLNNLRSMWLKNDYSKIYNFYFELNCTLPFVCSFDASPTLDLMGAEVQSLMDDYLKTISISSVNLNNKSGFIISSLDEDLFNLIVEQIISLNGDAVNWFYKWCVFNAENMAMNISWWESLREDQRRYIIDLGMCGAGEMEENKEKKLYRKRVRIFSSITPTYAKLI